MRAAADAAALFLFPGQFFALDFSIEERTASESGPYKSWRRKAASTRRRDYLPTTRAWPAE